MKFWEASVIMVGLSAIGATVITGLTAVFAFIF